MARRRNSIADKLNLSQLAIHNTLNDPEIQAAVARYGYSPEKMQAGKQLYDTASQLTNRKARAAGAQKAAYDRCQALLQTASGTYQALSKVCYAIFLRDKSKLTFLGLKGKTPRRIPAFLIRAYTLFDNAQLPEIQADLANFGYNIQRLQEERKDIAALEQAYRQLQQLRGSKQQTTHARREAVKLMDDWTRQYHKIARVALKHTPEFLEKLGIRVYSARTPAQRAAAAKAAKSRTVGNNDDNPENPAGASGDNPATNADR
jgi:hypothetical protein